MSLEQPTINQKNEEGNFESKADSKGQCLKKLKNLDNRADGKEDVLYFDMNTIPSDLQGDEDILKTLFKNPLSGYNFSRLPEHLRVEEKNIDIAIERSFKNIQHIPDNKLSDNDFLIGLIKKHKSLPISSIPDKKFNDEEFVKGALGAAEGAEQVEEIFKKASKNIREKKEIALLAVEKGLKYDIKF